MNKHRLSLLILMIFLMGNSVIHAFPAQNQLASSKTFISDASAVVSDYYQPVVSSNVIIKITAEYDPLISLDHWVVKSSFHQKRIINHSFATNYWQPNLSTILFPFHEFL